MLLTLSTHNLKNTLSIQLSSKASTLELSLEDALEKLRFAIKQQQVINAEYLAEQIIAQVPSCTLAYHLFYKVLSYQQKHSKLVHYAQKLISNCPNDALSHQTLANGYRFMRFPDKALVAMKHAVELAPENILWRNDLGIMYKEMGELVPAQQCFEQCITQQGDFTQPYWHRSDITPQMPAPYVTTLQELVKREDSAQTNVQKVHAAYALFRHFEAKKAYQTAFEFLSLGASTQRRVFTYNHQAELTEHQAIATAFSKGFFEKRKVSGENVTECDSQAPSDSPIFICGLPRSGTTLAEQIISAHSLVAAGDELYELAQATQDVLQQVKPTQQFPFWSSELSSKHWENIGKQYLILTKHINVARYFTDKMPLNYKAIGLISQALPQAKIIYCHRPPMDLLLGAYKQILSSGNKYSYDLDELTDMIIAQHNLIQHWQAVLPSKIFTLSYSDLINNQEEVTRALLDFLGLTFQQACIDFHTNPRAVHTVSNTQIRKPIFTSSINAWHKYHDQLNPYAIKMQKAGLTI